MNNAWPLGLMSFVFIVVHFTINGAEETLDDENETDLNSKFYDRETAAVVELISNNIVLCCVYRTA